jgi:hypothetical protein
MTRFEEDRGEWERGIVPPGGDGEYATYRSPEGFHYRRRLSEAEKARRAVERALQRNSFTEV